METDPHLKQFTGWFIPVEIIRLYESREIKLKSMFLLALIDSLCKNGSGCYASNEWLASYMQMSSQRVQELLSELRRLDLIHTEFRDGRKGRVLTTKGPLSSKTRISDTLKNEDIRYPQKRGYQIPSKSRRAHSFVLRSNTHSYDEASSNEASAAGAAQGGSCGKASLFGTEPITFDQLACRKFIQIVLERGKVVSPASRKHWTIEFRRLRLTDGISKERIKAVIKWYAHHVMDKYTPKAYHPVEFRRKFLSIEDCMKRTHEEAAPAVVSPEASALVSTLLELVWPPKARAKLPEVVQSTLDSYGAMRLRVSEQASKWKKEAVSPTDLPSKLLRVHSAVASIWRNPSDFTRAWFTSLHKSHAGWAEWSGDVSAFAFRPDHPHFQKMGYAEFRSYSSNEALWSKYLAALT